MIAEAFWLAQRQLASPAMAWRGDQLWIAYIDLQNNVRLGRLAGETLIDHLTPLRTEYRPSMAIVGDTIYLAVVTTDNRIALSFSGNGVTFSPPTFIGDSVEPPAMAAWLGAPLIAWAESSTAEIHLTRLMPGLVTHDHATGVECRWAPALASDNDPISPRLAVAYRERGGDQKTLVSILEPGDWNLQTRLVSVPDRPSPELAVAFCPWKRRDDPAVIVAWTDTPEPLRHTRDIHNVARCISLNDGSATGIERMGLSSAGPALSVHRNRLFVAWSDMSEHHDHIGLGGYDRIFSLPPELQGLLKTACDPTQCPPDPRLVCSPTDVLETLWQPANIVNARKGDLILTPAGGNGFIGGFLKELKWEQKYDHMGIMVADHNLIRHCTMAKGRIKADPYQNGSILGSPAPTDGLRPDILKYGWPGTITQNIEDGFFWGFNTPGHNPRWELASISPGDEALVGSDDPEIEGKRLRRRLGFIDPEGRELKNDDGDVVDSDYHDDYTIPNLTWISELRMDGSSVPPLVVRPPPATEATDPEVRARLHAIADRAMSIDGHYRFYAYSDAAMALRPGAAQEAMTDPLVLARSAGARWAVETFPLVCSTFVWFAARDPRGGFLIEGEAEATAEEAYRSGAGNDGLYSYATDERQAAGRAMHEHLANEVRQAVWDKLIEIQEDVPWLETALRAGLPAILSLISAPSAALLALIGLSWDNVAKLTLALSDMPNDVATQFCNTFAADRPTEKDDELWKEAGAGVSVAPHDIIHLWDAAAPGTSVGYWGHSETMLMQHGRFVRTRQNLFLESAGYATISGRVFYRGEQVVGAQVRAACQSALTSSRAGYVLNVSAGRHELIAGASLASIPGSDAPNWWLEGRLLIDAPPGDSGGYDIKLEDPPNWRRVLRCEAKVNVKYQTVIGENDTENIVWPIEFRLAYYPADWEVSPSPSPGPEKRQTRWVKNERGVLEVTASLRDDLAVEVTVSFKLIEAGEDEPEDSGGFTLTIPEDESANRVIHLKSGEVTPDRATLDITMYNLRDPA